LVITDEIARLTELPSQWNGKVEIELMTNRAFGGKTFSCLIRIRADVAATDLRWPTLFHEAFHCFSVERNADATLAYIGYEEGVVEQLQRRFRRLLLDRLQVSVAEERFVDRDANSAYNDYIYALEQMRQELGDASPEFYIGLLGTPLEQRWALMRERIMQATQWRRPDLRERWSRWEQVLCGNEVYDEPR